MRDLTVTVAGVFWAMVLLLVGGRFIALLAGANANSEIIERIYRHSDFWMGPFFDFGFTSKVAETGGVFEAASLLAFIVYFAIGLFLMWLLRSFFYGGYLHRGHGHV